MRNKICQILRFRRFLRSMEDNWFVFIADESSPLQPFGYSAFHETINKNRQLFTKKYHFDSKEALYKPEQPYPTNLYALVFVPGAIPINATSSLETSEFAADQTYCRVIWSAATLCAFSLTVMLN